MTDDKIIAVWFKEWHETLRKNLMRFCGVSRSDAEDLVHETFVRVIRYPIREEIKLPYPYLYKIAKNILIDNLERIRNIHPHREDWLKQLTIEEEDQPDEQIAKEQIRERCLQYIEQLPPNQRLVVKGFWHENLTYDQIAQNYGRTPRMVLRDIVKAYANLRNTIDEDLRN